VRQRTCARGIQEPGATVISRRTFPIGTLDKDRHINGFNDSADPKDLEHDLTQALVEFKESAAKDPAFVDAKIGTISCLGNLMYLARGHADRVQELLAQSTPLVKEVRASHPRDYTFEDCFSGRLALRVHSIPKCCSNPKFHLDV